MDADESSRSQESGVDLTLIRWMLTLTPSERLDVLDQYAADARQLRELYRESWGSERSSTT